MLAEGAGDLRKARWTQHDQNLKSTMKTKREYRHFYRTTKSDSKVEYTYPNSTSYRKQHIIRNTQIFSGIKHQQTQTPTPVLQTMPYFLCHHTTCPNTKLTRTYSLDPKCQLCHDYMDETPQRPMPPPGMGCVKCGVVVVSAGKFADGCLGCERMEEREREEVTVRRVRERERRMVEDMEKKRIGDVQDEGKRIGRSEGYADRKGEEGGNNESQRKFPEQERNGVKQREDWRSLDGRTITAM